MWSTTRVLITEPLWLVPRPDLILSSYRFTRVKSANILAFQLHFSDCQSIRPRPFTVVFDTGSGHLILPSSCDTLLCHVTSLRNIVGQVLPHGNLQGTPQVGSLELPGCQTELDCILSCQLILKGIGGVHQQQPKILIGMGAWLDTKSHW